jgi:hypothetical protein
MIIFEIRTFNNLLSKSIIVLLFMCSFFAYANRIHKPVFHESRKITDEKNYTKYISDGETVPDEFTGEKNIGIKVIDSDTKKSVENYEIFVTFIYKFKAENTNFKRKFPGKIIYLGHLKSKKVNDHEGMCEYENLPGGSYLITIFSDKYLPVKKIVNTENIEGFVIVELEIESVLKGKIVDADTNTPLKNMPVQLECGKYNTVGYYDKSIETDKKGCFEFKGLAEGDYIFSLGDSSDSIKLITNSLKNEVMEKYRDKIDENDFSIDEIKRKINKNLRDGFRRDYYIHPYRSIITVKSCEIKDVGTIKMEKVPSIEIDVVDQEGNSLIEFPVEVNYGKGPFIDIDNKYKTDHNGKLFLPLIDFIQDTPVMIFVPERLERIYNIADDTAPRLDYENFADGLKLENIAKERERLKKYAESGNHPNSRVIYPKPGENVKVKIKYKPVKGFYNARIKILDKDTSKPIPDFDILVSDDDTSIRFFLSEHIQLKLHSLIGNNVNDRYLKSIDNTGTLRIPGLNYNFTGTMMIAVETQGYAKQSFEIPVEKVLRNDEIVLELEQVAEIFGRIINRNTGKPFNFTVPENKKRQYRNRKPVIIIEVINRMLKGEYDPSKRNPQFNERFFCEVKKDGTFTIKNLMPHDKWTLKANVPNLPPYVKNNISIEPGKNDLGDILIGSGGTIEGIISDKQGKYVKGAHIVFPLESVNSRFDNIRMMSNEVGVFGILTSEISAHRQILRVIPPWGYKEGDYYGQNEMFLWYDTVTEIDKSDGLQIHPVLDKGNKLSIEIPITAQLKDINEYYSRIEIAKQFVGFGRNSNEFYFAISRICLLGLDKTEENFVYSHIHSIPDGGIKITTQTLKIDVPFVPEGKFGLRIDGSIFLPLELDGEKTYNPYCSIPLSYSEILMSNNDYKINIDFQSTEVEFELTGRPENYGERNTGEIVLLFERKVPLSTGMGGDVQRIMKSSQLPGGRTPEEYITNYISYFGAFLQESRSKLSYSNYIIKSVPPGEYKAIVFTNIYTMSKSKPEGFYSVDIVIPENEKKVYIKIPYKK